MDEAEEVRVVLTVADGRAASRWILSGGSRTATIVLGYADALAMARGELDPADALAAGRVRVRGRPGGARRRAGGPGRGGGAARRTSPT